MQKAFVTRKSLMALFLLLAGGCAPVTVHTTVLVPARYEQAAQMRTIAVLPFDNAGGKEFASEIEGTLAGIMINDKQFFSIVDRASLDKVTEEMKLSMTGLVDASTAAKVGNLAGAKGIYTGVISESSVNDSRYQEKRSRCVSEATRTDKRGKQYQECVQYQDYPVGCIKRTASFAFTPKLIEVETGKILYSRTIEKKFTDSGCSDKRTVAPGADLMRKARDAAREEFRDDVAPHRVAVSFTLMDSTSDIKSSEAEKKVKSGLEFSKHDRLDRGCELWQEAKALSPTSVTILYDLGVCAEVAGRLDDALASYKEADQRLSKPDDKVSAALARISQAIETRKKLSGQVPQ